MPINGSWRQLRVEMSHLISKVNYTLTFYSSIYSYFGSLQSTKQQLDTQNRLSIDILLYNLTLF